MPAKLRRPERWITAGGLLLSLALAGWIYQSEERHNQAAFDHQAKAHAAAIDTGMDNAADVVEDLNQLFVANKGEVSHEQFTLFTRPMRERFPYIEALAFHRLIGKAERPAFEARRRREFPGFFISDIVDGHRVPAPLRDRYCVIDYRMPEVGNKLPFGVDLLTLEKEDEALRRATDLGVSTATDMVNLLSPEMNGRVFRILMAVYKDGKTPLDVTTRRKTVIGYTVSLVRPQDLIEHILDGSKETLSERNFSLRIYASSAPDSSQLAYQSADNAAAGEADGQWLSQKLAPYHYGFYVAGLPWHLEIAAPALPFHVAHIKAILAFFFSLLVTLATAGYVHWLSIRTWRVERLVGERTEELRQVNELLTQDIHIRTAAELALRESQEALRELAAHQERVREDERKRIARDIHDDLGQNLMALRIDISLLGSKLDPGVKGRELINAPLQQIDTTIQAVRNIINDLRPAVLDLGLVAALEWQAREFSRRTGIACHTDLPASLELSDEYATALFRIVQEGLSNIARHARAASATVRIEAVPGELLLEIADDGIGMWEANEASSKSFGLIGIRERIRALGGHCEIVSQPGAGTRLAFRLPAAQPGLHQHPPGAAYADAGTLPHPEHANAGQAS